MATRTFRPSDIKLFKRCRRQWNLKYVRGLGGAKREDTASLGTLVHAGLEAHYKGHGPKATMLRAVPVPATEAAVDQFEQAWIMVEGYLEWLEETGIDAGLQVEAVEKTLQVEVPTLVLGDKIVLVGHIDLLATDAFGIRKLIDHKTVQSLDQYSRQLQVDDQMLTYAVMLKLEGTEIGGAIHNAIKRSKRTARATPPFYQRNEVTYSAEHLRSHYSHLLGVLHDMVYVLQTSETGLVSSQELFYPTPTKDCTWDCPFLGVCALHDDGSDIESALEFMSEKALSRHPR